MVLPISCLGEYSTSLIESTKVPKSKFVRTQVEDLGKILEDPLRSWIKIILWNLDKILTKILNLGRVQKPGTYILKALQVAFGAKYLNRRAFCHQTISPAELLNTQTESHISDTLYYQVLVSSSSQTITDVFGPQNSLFIPLYVTLCFFSHKTMI